MRLRLRVAVASVVLSVAALVARAEDVVDRSELRWEKAADRLVAAAAEGPDALDAAVRTPQVDPWVLADALLRRGRFDLADAVVAGSEGPRFTRLGAYVAAQREHPLDAAVRDARDRIAVVAKTGDLAATAAALDAAPPATASVPGAWIENVRGVVASASGHPAEAIAAFRKAADLAAEIGWLELEHAALKQGGVTAFQCRDSDAAMELLQRQVPVAEIVATPEDLAGCVINIGSLSAQLNRWDDAVLWLRRGLDLTLPSVGGDPAKVRNYRLNDLLALGQVHYHRGEYAHVVGILDEAPALAAALGRTREEAVIRLFLARACLVLELGERGADEFRRAAQLFAALGDVAQRREALLGAAACLVDLDRIDDALAVHGQLAELAQSADLSVAERVNDLGERALALQSAGRLDEADAAYAAAHELALGAGDAGSAAWIGLNRASLFCERGQFAEARPLLEAALAVGAQHDIAYYERHALRWLAEAELGEGHAALARAHVDRGLERAATLLAGLSDAETARARAALLALVDVGMRAALADGDAAGALRYSESGRGLGLVEMLGARAAEAAAAIPSELREAADSANRRVTEARGLLAAARAEGKLKEARSAREALDAALAAFDVARRAIERESKLAADTAYPEAADAAQLARVLGADQALIEFAPVGPDLHAFVLRADGSVRDVRLGTLAEAFQAASALASASTSAERSAAGAALRGRIVTPLALGDDVRSVVVVPWGALHQIPLSLAAPELDVSYAPSATVLLHLRADEPARDAGVLALGNPDYTAGGARSSAVASRGNGLAPLPATALEIRGIARAAADTSLLAGDATEARLRDALASRPRWHAVHLACHGLVDSERPALSALALTPGGLDDGYLTALEISSLDVRADLVVLSACDTSRGAVRGGEGLVGLMRSFMIAGAPRVLCSLWPVDDEATRALMVRFYDLWNPPADAGRAPLPPAAALRDAQRSVREDPDHPEWADPRYWAAWMLWGRAD